MLPAIRLATLRDLPAIVALLIQDAEARRSLDPMLWRIAGDASTRIEDYADILALSADASSGANLLAAAESAFARRAIDGALVVCPAGWSSKISLLERRGYQTAKLWMLRH